MSNLKLILSKLDDFSSLDKESFTHGDSAIGQFRDENGKSYIIKQSKKANPDEIFTDEEREQAILNDIFTELFTSKLANNIPSLSSAEYLLGRRNDVNFFIIILSKDFVNSDQTELNLVHGSQIFDLAGDAYPVDLLSGIHKKKVVFFTIELILEKITDYLTTHAPYVTEIQKENIKLEFLKICFFDGLVGNQDRHIQNWGIINQAVLDTTFVPMIAPIYDTARAFMWNIRDDKLADENIEDYCNKSKAFPGLIIGKKVNHFELISGLIVNYPNSKEIFKQILNEAKAIDLDLLLNDELTTLAFCTERKNKIREMWSYRLKIIEKILG